MIPNIHLLKQVVSSPLLEAVLDSNQRRASELAAENDTAVSTEEYGLAGHAGKVLANR